MKPDIGQISAVKYLLDERVRMYPCSLAQRRKQLLSLTCVIHHIDVGSQFGAGEVVTVLDRVVQS